MVLQLVTWFSYFRQQYSCKLVNKFYYSVTKDHRPETESHVSHFKISLLPFLFNYSNTLRNKAADIHRHYGNETLEAQNKTLLYL